ncbi:fasciclin domain-containing protein [Sphingobacterium sp. LRF_L2]|uniref:fasciclin domain-containing protein n=1 Tax=Sphingobacterium sp. LRF_L2 TaxID=3369421 RepID=UPI003F603C0F
MKTKKTACNRFFLFFLSLLVSLISACRDDFEGETFTAYEETPIATYLKSNPEKYALWVEILEKADLFNTLNLSTVYTHFVPSNEGVERYLKKMNLSSVAELSKEDANYLVRYHLIPAYAIDLGQFQAGSINDLTATDDNLFVEFREGGLESIYLNGESRFNAFDIKATNGIIHGIDDVLTPLTATVADRIAVQKYSLFKEIVSLTGYEQRLATVYTEGTDALGNPIQQRFKYTAFVVSDDVYASEGINSLNDLLVKLNVSSGSDYTNVNNGLNKYVAYHLMDQQRSFADLGQFPTGTKKMNLATMAQNELVKISEDGTGLIINEDVKTNAAIGFLETNIACKNGVVHEVDNWMPLFLPEQVSVVWEFTDYPDIAANVTQYRNKSLGSQYNKTFLATDLTSITWLSQPESKSNVLIYRNNRSADGIFYTGTLNYDHLRVELGESGWIQMKSPTIVRGKYKVKLVWPSTKYTSSTGICAFVLDNVMIYPRLIMSNTSADKVMTQEFGTIEFPETTDHTLRILSLDGKLLTLDYIQFDPVE